MASPPLLALLELLGSYADAAKAKLGPFEANSGYVELAFGINLAVRVYPPLLLKVLAECKQTYGAKAKAYLGDASLNTTDQERLAHQTNRLDDNLQGVVDGAISLAKTVSLVAAIMCMAALYYSFFKWPVVFLPLTPVLAYALVKAIAVGRWWWFLHKIGSFVNICDAAKKQKDIEKKVAPPAA